MSIEIRLKEQRGELNFDIDLSLPNSGITALFGPSGAGKTTLLRVVAGLERLSSARVSVDNSLWQDTQNFTPTHERGIGFVFQEPSLFSHLTVQGNLDYALRRTTVKPALKLTELIELLGIQRLLGRSARTLSGGEQQRVAIARALASNPKLLLMDEPLAAVDQERRNDILPFIENLHAALKLPVLYVSHSTDEVARIADHIALIDHGRCLGDGPIEAMLSRVDMPLAQRDDAESIVFADCQGFDPENQINTMKVSEHSLLVPGAEFNSGQRVRMRIAARDVSLTLEKQQDTSILNILPATILAMQDLSSAQILVSLSVGSQTLLARLTQLSARRLDLRIGQQVYAQVKSIAVLN